LGRTKYDHVHIYEKISVGTTFKCTVPGCPHFISEKLLVGRRAACYKCKDTFIVTTEHLRRKKLGCMDCEKPPTADKEKNAFADLVKKMLAKEKDDAQAVERKD
jgi:hypothetical protein